jgi:hypothetical protein
MRAGKHHIEVTRKTKRPRTERREATRTARKLADLRERLFSLEEGGTPERPIAVASASVVEPHASALPCPRCNGEMRVTEHVAGSSAGGLRVREARLVCKACGAPRSVWFKIEADVVN